MELYGGEWAGSHSGRGHTCDSFLVHSFVMDKDVHSDKNGSFLLPLQSAKIVNHMYNYIALVQMGSQIKNGHTLSKCTSICHVVAQQK